MSPETRKRLQKLMMLTTSSNDHEALSALRHANAILKRENMTWDTVLNITHKHDLRSSIPNPYPYQNNAFDDFMAEMVKRAPAQTSSPSPKHTRKYCWKEAYADIFGKNPF